MKADIRAQGCEIDVKGLCRVYSQMESDDDIVKRNGITGALPTFTAKMQLEALRFFKQLCSKKGIRIEDVTPDEAITFRG